MQWPPGRIIMIFILAPFIYIILLVLAYFVGQVWTAAESIPYNATGESGIVMKWMHDVLYVFALMLSNPLILSILFAMSIIMYIITRR